MTSTSIILSDVSVTVDFSGTSFFPPRHFFLSCHPNIYLFSPEEVPTDQYYLFEKSHLLIFYTMNERLYIIQKIMGKYISENGQRNEEK